MLVKELIKKLENYDQDIEVIIDYDEDGWYATDNVCQITTEDGDKMISIDHDI